MHPENNNKEEEEEEVEVVPIKTYSVSANQCSGVLSK